MRSHFVWAKLYDGASDQFIVRFTRNVNCALRRCSRSIYPNLRGVFRTRGQRARKKKQEREREKREKEMRRDTTKSDRKGKESAPIVCVYVCMCLYVYVFVSRVQSCRQSATSRSRIYDALITMQFSMDHGDGRTVHYERRLGAATIIANVSNMSNKSRNKTSKEKTKREMIARNSNLSVENQNENCSLSLRGIIFTVRFYRVVYRRHNNRKKILCRGINAAKLNAFSTQDKLNVWETNF